jgi:hypothetical protein
MLYLENTQQARHREFLILAKINVSFLSRFNIGARITPQG